MFGDSDEDTSGDAPPVATLTVAEAETARLDAELAKMVEKDPMTTICATAPGVGIIFAATFVSVLDDAKRLRNARAVAFYRPHHGPPARLT